MIKTIILVVALACLAFANQAHLTMEEREQLVEQTLQQAKHVAEEVQKRIDEQKQEVFEEVQTTIDETKTTDATTQQDDETALNNDVLEIQHGDATTFNDVNLDGKPEEQVVDASQSTTDETPEQCTLQSDCTGEVESTQQIQQESVQQIDPQEIVENQALLTLENTPEQIENVEEPQITDTQQNQQTLTADVNDDETPLAAEVEEVQDKNNQEANNVENTEQVETITETQQTEQEQATQEETQTEQQVQTEAVQAVQAEQTEQVEQQTEQDNTQNTTTETQSNQEEQNSQEQQQQQEESTQTQEEQTQTEQQTEQVQLEGVQVDVESSEQVSQEQQQYDHHDHQHEHHEHDRHHEHDHHEHDHHEHDHHEHNHDHHDHHDCPHHHHHEHHIETQQVPSQDWNTQLNFVPNYCQLKSQLQAFQKKLPQLLEQQLPNEKLEQVGFSVLVVSFPSIPIFLFLLITVGIRNRGTAIQYMIAFSFGTMLGDVFFHMLPQIQGTHVHNHDSHDHHDHSESPQLCIVLTGVLLFAFVDLFIIKLKNLRGAKDDSHDHEHNNSTFVFLFGDFLHNFTDGIALGVTFNKNIMLGVSTTIAIFMHEIPHEVGDFAYLLKQGKCVFVILATQIFTSLGCLAGGFVGLKYADKYQTELLGITCGSFLYVALVNILPELKQSFAYRPTIKRLLFNLVSIAAGLHLMKFVGQLE